jgi:hypothetical protein
MEVARIEVRRAWGPRSGSLRTRPSVLRSQSRTCLTTRLKCAWPHSCVNHMRSLTVGGTSSSRSEKSFKRTFLYWLPLIWRDKTCRPTKLCWLFCNPSIHYACQVYHNFYCHYMFRPSWAIIRWLMYTIMPLKISLFNGSGSTRRMYPYHIKATKLSQLILSKYLSWRVFGV